MEKIRRNYPDIAPAGPTYNRAIRSGNWLFISGCTARGTLAQGKSLMEQLRVTLDRITRIVATEGGTPGDIVRITTYVTSIADWRAHVSEQQALFADLTLSSAKRYDQGDLTGAIEEATKALEIRIPVSQFLGARLVIGQVQALAHAVRGSAYLRVRQYEKAVADASKAVELDPRARYYALRADAYRALGGHDDKALADARKAIELDPKVVPGHVARAIARPKVRISRSGVEPTQLTTSAGGEVEWEVEDPEWVRLNRGTAKGGLRSALATVISVTV